MCSIKISFYHCILLLLLYLCQQYDMDVYVESYCLMYD